MNSAYGDTRVARRLVWTFGILDAVLLVAALCSTANGDGGWLLALLPLMIASVVVCVYVLRHGLLFELLVEYKWKRTCAGIGGNFVGQGRARLQAGISYDPYGSIKKTKVVRDTIYPIIRQVSGNWQGWTGVIRPFYGQNIDDYNKQADRFALAFHVPFLTFELDESGLIRVRAGQVPVPDAYAFTGHLHASQAQTQQPLLQQAVRPPQTVPAQFKQPVPQQVVPIEEVPPGVLRAADTFAIKRGLPAVSPVSAQNQQAPDVSRELELLKGVPMARDTAGRVCRIPIESNHWFVAARTGGGKGSWLWSLVLGLAPAWRAGLVKFYGIDPKLIELSMGRGFFEYYADDDQSCVELLEKAVNEMHASGLF